MRHLIFIDLETSGLNPLQHCILEIALVIVDVHTGQRIASYESVVKVDRVTFRRSEEGALKCNGFTWKKICDEGVNSDIIRQDIINLFCKHDITYRNSKFIACNCTFDKPFFTKFVGSQRMFPSYWIDFPSVHFGVMMNNGVDPDDIQFAKDKIAVTHELPPEEKPHRAMNGVEHMLLLYENVVSFPKKLK